MLSQTRKRKRRGTAATLRAFRLGDSLATSIEAEALRGYCEGLLPADEYAALVAKSEAEYLDPWQRVKFWGAALGRVEAVRLA